MKRIVFCFDGTWNRLGVDTPTNVVLTAASIERTTKSGVTQIIHYDEGVGTAWYDKAAGGMFGTGLVDNVREAYRFLIFNYDPGDEIFVFGFSRGAYSARTFIGFLRHVGPLRRLHADRIDEALALYRRRLRDEDGASDAMCKFRAEYSSNVCIGVQDEQWRCRCDTSYVPSSAPIMTVKYLGVWDTVDAMGVPSMVPLSTMLNRRHAFHDMSLTGFVENARHAVAIDERHSLFSPILFGDLDALNKARGFSCEDEKAPYQERWFAGTHGSVGGGGHIRGLSDGALAWIMKGAYRAQLGIDYSRGSRIQAFYPDPLVSLENETAPGWSATKVVKADRDGPSQLWQLAPSVVRRWQASAEHLPGGQEYRPKTLSKLATALDALPETKTMPLEKDLLTTHIVVEGDQLGKLARKYYGNANLYPVIFDANQDFIDDADDIFVNQKLRIPKITTQAGGGVA